MGEGRGGGDEGQSVIIVWHNELSRLQWRVSVNPPTPVEFLGSYVPTICIPDVIHAYYTPCSYVHAIVIMTRENSTWFITRNHVNYVNMRLGCNGNTRVQCTLEINDLDGRFVLITAIVLRGPDAVCAYSVLPFVLFDYTPRSTADVLSRERITMCVCARVWGAAEWVHTTAVIIIWYAKSIRPIRIRNVRIPAAGWGVSPYRTCIPFIGVWLRQLCVVLISVILFSIHSNCVLQCHNHSHVI